MASRNYIKLLYFLLLPALFVGCGRGVAPAYDNGESKAFLDACEAITGKRDEEALSALKNLQDISGENGFCTEARLALNRRIHFDAIEEYLSNEDYQGLRLYLAGKASTGEAGVETLAWDSVPDALRALSLFTARMPWESSPVLQDALDSLSPYLDTLGKSPAFVQFHQKQLDKLQSLKKQEKLARSASYISVLENAVVTGDSRKFYETRADFLRNYGSHYYFAFESCLEKNKAVVPKPGEGRAYAIALASAYPTLSAAKRKTAMAGFSIIKSEAGICGKLVNTMSLQTLESYEAFFESADALGHTASAYTVAGYLKLLPLKSGLFQGWFWRSPCPGFTESIMRLRQINNTMPFNNLGNRK